MDVINQIIDSLTDFVGWDTKYKIDGPVFNLHCKVTVILLLVFSAIISAGQFIGDPIDCVVEDFDNLASIMDTYCWIHSTFTLPRMILNKENEDGEAQNRRKKLPKLKSPPPSPLKKKNSNTSPSPKEY